MDRGDGHDALRARRVEIGGLSVIRVCGRSHSPTGARAAIPPLDRLEGLSTEQRSLTLVRFRREARGAASKLAFERVRLSKLSFPNPASPIESIIVSTSCVVPAQTRRCAQGVFRNLDDYPMERPARRLVYLPNDELQAARGRKPMGIKLQTLVDQLDALWRAVDVRTAAADQLSGGVPRPPS